MTDQAERADSVVVHARIVWGSDLRPVSHLAELAAAVQVTHPGNRYYRFSVGIGDPTQIFLNEAWDTMGDFEHHATLAETLEIGDVVRAGATEVQLHVHTVAFTLAVPFATVGE